jgi:glycerol-3-phosphate dehydrogenase
LSVLLVEQSDFSAATSSRSSKFVHGGQRYLKNGPVHLTYESITARQRLLAQGEGLVTPIRILMAHADALVVEEQ